MLSNRVGKMRLACLGLVAMVLVTALAVTAGSARAETERYYAFAVNMGSIGAGMSTSLNISISRWTTDEERIALLGVVTQYANKKKGQDELVKALQAQKETGWVEIISASAMSSGFPSTRMRYAREFPDEQGGKEIIMVTDRPIGFGEALRSPTTTNYPISVIILNLDKEGNGEGVLHIGVQVLMDEKTGQVKIGQYTTEPVRLTKVKPRT